ncbi:MAG: Mur ligase family protein [Turicibacter sp.]
MKNMMLNQITPIIKGTLLKGNKNLLITNVVQSEYIKNMTTANTLIFLSHQHPLNIQLLKHYTPCAVVVDKMVDELFLIKDCTIIQVKNVERSYLAFIDYYRNLFDIPVIAVTGTCGKTTTKDMLKHILGQFYTITGTQKSANGYSHHLRYLLTIDDKTDAAIFETPVGAPGHLLNSGRYFKPTIGIITNIGIDHLDLCKTLDTYIKAKGDMVKVVDPNGVLVLNADDENTKKINISSFKGKIVYIGINNKATFKASYIKYAINGMEFLLTHDHQTYEVFVPGYGIHQVYNCLSALAAICQLDISLADAIQALKSFIPLERHFQTEKGINGSLIIDDTYSLNPTSLEAGLDTLCGIANGRRKIALFPNINTLGDNTKSIHFQVGDMMSKKEIDILITVGSDAKIIADQCKRNGFKGQIYSFKTVSGVREFLIPLLDKNTVLLVKCDMYNTAMKELVKSLY